MSNERKRPIEAITCNHRFISGNLLKFGIPKLDHLFNDGIGGSVIEFFGLPSSGKSMLIYTIMLNILEQADLNIIFIDTKCDFQAVKLRNMMIAREIPEQKIREMLKRISVNRSSTAEEVIAQLKFVVQTPHQHTELGIVVIDSITILDYFLLGHNLYRLKHIEEIMLLIRKLTDRNITVFVVNIAHYRDNYVKFDSSSKPNSQQTSSKESSDDSNKFTPIPSLRIYPALGALWEKLADYKVLINFTENPHRYDSDLEAIYRQLSIYSAKTLAPTLPVNIEITSAGIV